MEAMWSGLLGSISVWACDVHLISGVTGPTGRSGRPFVSTPSPTTNGVRIPPFSEHDLPSGHSPLSISFLILKLKFRIPSCLSNSTYGKPSIRFIMANIHFIKTNEASMLDRDFFVNGMAFIILLDFLSTLVDVDSRARGEMTPALTLFTSETRQVLFFCVCLGTYRDVTLDISLT